MSRIPAQMYIFNTKNNKNKIIQAAIKAWVDFFIYKA